MDKEKIADRIIRSMMVKGSEMKIAMSFNGYYELSNGSPVVWAIFGGNDDIERLDVLDAFLKNANKLAEFMLKKAGISLRDWERKDFAYSNSNKVAGLVHLVGDPIESYSILEALANAGFKYGRP